MTFFGLHTIDASILLVYIVGVLLVGKWLSHRIKNESDFFLAGRKLGKWFQFFLNFGNMTDPGQAATTSSSVYLNGAGGSWLGLIPLLMSPISNWFLPVWYRRVRLTTTADIFDDRFGRKFIGLFYAIFILVVSMLSIGLGNIVAYKTLAPIMVKAPAEYSPAEKQMVVDYQEFTTLRQERKTQTLTSVQTGRYTVLKDLYDRDRLQPYVSHLSAVPFYLSSCFLIALFLMLGGLQGSAMVDALQAVLTIVISFILVPFGLSRIGGLHAFHQKVPNEMFQIFGDTASEYTWYSIGALLLVSLIGTVGATASMAVNGSANSELAARLGAFIGGFTKRFVTIAWCICGLIAVALFGRNLSDPDHTWGLLTRTLLPTGMIGLMIVGILGGKLAYMGANLMSLSALIVRNLYVPLFPGRSERHYIVAARVSIPVVLLLGIGVALYMNSAVELLKFMIVILVVWGAPIFLIFVWRRVTEMAVRLQMIGCMIFIAVIPWVVSAVPSLREAPSLTVTTHPVPGSRQEPAAAFFESVAHVRAGDLSSPLEGLGRFDVEVYLVSKLGVDVTQFGAAGLMTTRFLVDSALPLVLLILFSYMTPQTDPERVVRFYARMKTPVFSDPAIDALEVEASYANPTRFDHTKLFPRSNWEFTKWSKVDTIGFLLACASVGVVLVIFKAVLMLGS